MLVSCRSCRTASVLELVQTTYQPILPMRTSNMVLLLTVRWWLSENPQSMATFRQFGIAQQTSAISSGITDTPTKRIYQLALEMTKVRTTFQPNTLIIRVLFQAIIIIAFRCG